MSDFTITLLERNWLSKTTFELTFSRPLNFEYVPGQRIRILHQNVARDYSLISSHHDPELVVYLRLIEKGLLTPVLADLAYGSSVTASGPFGYFNYHSSGRPAVFVATGTGIAPFVAFVRSGARPMILLHGVRSLEALHYQDELFAAAETYVPCLSSPVPPAGSDLDVYEGRVATYLTEHLPQAVYDFYLCGRRDMIREVTHLVDRHFPGSNVFSEMFY